MQESAGDRIDWATRAESLQLTPRNFVNGVARLPRGPAVVEKRGPRDGQPLYTLGISDAHEVDQAVAAARGAFEDGRWSERTVESRKDVLFKLAALVEQEAPDLALLESLDVGKPVSDACKGDLPATIATIRFCAEAADKLFSAVYASDRTSLSYELRRPIGVVCGIIGWNFPLLLAAQKVAPVLATGNCLVLKPSELTALSALRLAELALEAGVPAGVLNIVNGDASTGSALAHHPDIDLLSFTGSSDTGKALLQAAGRSNMKRLLLECGGKAPFLVFEDCPSLDAAAEAVVAGAFRNQGEVCVASSRLLVQASIKGDFLKRVIEKAAHFYPGDPLDPNTRYGALVSDAHLKKVRSYIDSGLRQGAVLSYQPRYTAPFEEGFYLAPTIFDAVPSHARIAQEEIFGPVLSVMTFRDEEEAVRIANETLYGLSAVVWTQNPGRAHRIARRLKAGWIVVNTTDKPEGGPAETVVPVGGHGQSGIGREGGLEGIEAYTSKTAVQWFT
jgi:acyl-CoA reductase-like NAD-dependent aldehyde dehydrogenase